MIRLPKPIRITAEPAPTTDDAPAAAAPDLACLTTPAGHVFTVARGRLVTHITVKTHLGLAVYAIPTRMSRALAAAILGPQAAADAGLAPAPGHRRQIQKAEEASEAFDYDAELERLDQLDKEGDDGAD